VSALSAMVLFCEDIRQEVSGQVSLVGILPDGLHLPGIPGMIPKLGMYVRAHIPVDLEPTTAYIYVFGPDTERTLVAQFDPEMIHRAQSEARAMGLPIAGVINLITASPFTVEKEGRLSIEMDWGEERLYLGNISIKDVNQSSEPGANARSA